MAWVFLAGHTTMATIHLAHSASYLGAFVMGKFSILFWRLAVHHGRKANAF